MKNLWQYKHWPDEKNPDETEPWIEGPPNPCTVFRVKWLEQIRTWARYVSGEFSENLLVVPPPEAPEPVTTETIVQEASFWDFLTFSGEWAQRWDRYGGIPMTAGVWAPTLVDLPEWDKFQVDDVLHPGAEDPNDVLMDRLAGFREYIEPIKAIEAKGYLGSSPNYFAYIVDEWRVGENGNISEPSPYIYIGANTGDNSDVPEYKKLAYYQTFWVSSLLFQRKYRVALASEPIGPGYGRIPAPYSEWPQSGLYCHEVFGQLPSEESEVWQGVNNIGRMNPPAPTTVWGGQDRYLRYFLLIDDDLPEDLNPILSPG